MSCYYCDTCDELKDRDIHGCNESKDNPYGNVCDDCICCDQCNDEREYQRQVNLENGV